MNDDLFHFDSYPELDTSDSLTLKIYFFSRHVFDPTYLTISLSLFPDYNWPEFYNDIKRSYSFLTHLVMTLITVTQQEDIN